jgi:hypothetical protein
VAFIATDKGLVKWQFLMQFKPEERKLSETFETVVIEDQKQMDCVMSETDAIFYKWTSQEF